MEELELERVDIIQSHSRAFSGSAYLTLSPGLAVDSVTLSLSGVGTGELSGTGRETEKDVLSAKDTTNRLMDFLQGLLSLFKGNAHCCAFYFVPGLLSRSSLSSRPPATPRSLDWSCTMIFSLLLIRHTELLGHDHEQDWLAWFQGQQQDG